MRKFARVHNVFHDSKRKTRPLVFSSQQSLQTYAHCGSCEFCLPTTGGVEAGEAETQPSSRVEACEAETQPSSRVEAGEAETQPSSGASSGVEAGEAETPPSSHSAPVEASAHMEICGLPKTAMMTIQAEMPEHKDQASTLLPVQPVNHSQRLCSLGGGIIPHVEADLGLVLCIYVAPMTGTFGNDIDLFLQSYEEFKAGCPHELLIVYKHNDIERFASTPESTWQENTGSQKLRYLDKHLSALHVNDGFDIGSYLDIMYDQTYKAFSIIVCISTPTVIQTQNWLHKLIRPLQSDRTVGLVGSCGSYEAGLCGFPNPHIRTAMFGLRRATFDACNFATSVRSKGAGYEFEHGRDSITRTVQGLGLQCLVVAASGNTYQPTRWHYKNGYADGDLSDMIATDRHARVHHSPA